MTDPDDTDFAVAARTRIEARNRERERRAARRDRRERILLWLLAPLLLPAAGAAASLALLEAGRYGLAAGVLAVPMLIVLWLARHRGRLEPFAWALICLAAELALVFWVGLVGLEYGPE